MLKDTPFCIWKLGRVHLSGIGRVGKARWGEVLILLTVHWLACTWSLVALGQADAAFTWIDFVRSTKADGRALDPVTSTKIYVCAPGTETVRNPSSRVLGVSESVFYKFA